MALRNQLMFDSAASLLEFFEGEGLTITRPDTGPFQAAMHPYYDELEAEFGKGTIAEIVETR